ncbi:hypothetical protein TSOC_004896 [Tetrabaena socialis]|uniref:ABC transporter Uup C-terminal domain-containing protein n=1 Tax=Tetrabaena socialis TaxID=47790 RepID=A0A2J8A7P1_9CHLO|nr:hypothetical protein TSOC_004896 [Tetrabaena socialis]|eukprot:PNH08541.1 hypothetical protein TSOC_004896 [Tetrabaena socialis]
MMAVALYLELLDEEESAVGVVEVQGERAASGAAASISGSISGSGSGSISDAESDWEAPAAPSNGASSGGGGGKGKGKGGKGKGQQQQQQPAAVASSSGAPGASAGGGKGSGASALAAAAAAAAAKKTRKLGYYEQQEYQKLEAEIDKLGVRRDGLNERVIALAQSGSDLAALEKASLEMASVQELIDSKSERWLELAELAGDI